VRSSILSPKVVLLAHFQFNVTAAIAGASQFVRTIAGFVRSEVGIDVHVAGGVALENIAVVFQLVLVERQNSRGGIVGFIFQSDNFDAVTEARNVYIGALVASVGVFLFQAGTGINR